MNLEEHDDDTHLCLLCQTSIHGLDNYVSHRRAGACHNRNRPLAQEENKSPSEVISLSTASDFFHYFQLQQKPAGSQAGENSFPSPKLDRPSSTSNHDDYYQRPSAAADHQQQPQVSPPQSPRLLEESESSSRVRRVSSDQAAFFMESLGLFVNTRVTPAPSIKDNSSQQKGNPCSPNRPAAREELWDESLLLWPTGHEMEQVLLGPPNSSPLQSEVTSRHRKPPSLLSFMRHSNDKLRCGRLSHQSSVPEEQCPRSPVASQDDFMRQIDLVNVASNSRGGSVAETHEVIPGGNRWKLWNPEQESDELWHDVLSQSEQLYFEEQPQSGSSDLLARPESNCMEIQTPENSEQGKPGDSVRCDQSLGSLEMLSELHSRKLATPLNTLGRRSRKKNAKYFGEANEKMREKSNPVTTHQVIVCPTCHYPTISAQFGKHLLSHYHLNHSKVSPNDPSARRLILEHICDVVRLSPYQCAPCQFYCNWDHEFVDHWRQTHTAVAEDKFWCSFCSHVSAGGLEMLTHLQSEKHDEIVVAISRVVPIVIRRISQSHCHICRKDFRLRFALRRHILSAHAENASFDQFQCEYCAFATHSRGSLASHAFLVHPDRRSRYNCRVCLAQFTTKKANEAHKRSATHRAKLCQEEGETSCASGSIHCQFCAHEAPELQSLKDHILQKHAAVMSQCGVCGDKFALQQDLGSHVRGNCKPEGVKIRGQFACGGEENCGFSADSSNMVLFHHALRHHAQAGRAANVFECNICGKTFTRSKLWEHVRVHGDAHRCGECYRIFTSLFRLEEHRRSSHNDSNQVFSCKRCNYSSLRKRLLVLHERRTHFSAQKCEKCGQVVTTFKAFHAHQKLHESADVRFHKCPEKDCLYAAKTSYDLKSHLLSHKPDVVRMQCGKCDFSCRRRSELNRHERNRHSTSTTKFHCELCDYSGGSKQHLQRHLLTHNKTVPSSVFQCRLCDHVSHSIDGLRKHVLKTSIHPDASMYNCDYCQFVTNETIDFRGHIFRQHSDVFSTAFSTMKYIEHYFAVRRK